MAKKKVHSDLRQCQLCTSTALFLKYALVSCQYILAQYFSSRLGMIHYLFGTHPTQVLFSARLIDIQQCANTTLILLSDLSRKDKCRNTIAEIRLGRQIKMSNTIPVWLFSLLSLLDYFFLVQSCGRGWLDKKGAWLSYKVTHRESVQLPSKKAESLQN